MDSEEYQSGSATQKEFNAKFMKQITSLKVLDNLKFNDKTINFAVYGCATGDDTIFIVKEKLSKYTDRYQLNLHLSDLESNDFNICDKNIKKQIKGVGIYFNYAFQSFYEKIYPDNLIDLGMCWNSTHWLKESEWPKEDCMLPQYSADNALVEKVKKAGEEDFLTMLKHREAEFKEGGLFLLDGPLTKGAEPAMYSTLWKAWESFVHKNKIDAIKRYMSVAFYFMTEEEIKKPFNEKSVKFEIVDYNTVTYPVAKDDIKDLVQFCKPLLSNFLEDVIENKLPLEYPDIKLTKQRQEELIEEYWKEADKLLRTVDVEDLENGLNGFQLILRKI